MKCPTCRKEIDAASPDRPFCSERCRTLDLANWATGRYVISADITEPIELELRPPGPESDAE